jgi:hypothetical protein
MVSHTCIGDDGDGDGDGDNGGGMIMMVMQIMMILVGHTPICLQFLDMVVCRLQHYKSWNTTLTLL